MPTQKFPHKPAAPSVRQTIGPSIELARLLGRKERPQSEQDLVRDILRKLDLPEPVARRLREQAGIDD